MLKSPKKLGEWVSKSRNLQYDKRSVEAELRVLAEEARKAADEMGGKRPAGSKEMRKKDTGSRNGAPDISGSTGVRIQVFKFWISNCSTFRGIVLYCVENENIIR